jgi:hypothetical protein
MINMKKSKYKKPEVTKFNLDTQINLQMTSAIQQTPENLFINPLNWFK